MLNNIYSKLTPFQGRQDIIINDQSVGDIMQNLLKTHNIYKSEYDKIAGNFERNGTENTARGIYNFIKTNIPYKIESDNRQLLKSPSAILYTANSIGSDCKNYSLFTGGILDALNRRGKRINWCYRFASYKMNDKLPHHVFVVINPGTSNEIWVDAVLPQFNYKKQYNYKVDKNPMALISMAGLEYESIGAPKRKEKKAAAKAAPKAAAPAKKAARQKRQAAAAAKLTPGQKIEQAKKIAKRKAEPTPKKIARKAKTKERAKKIKEGIKKTGKAIVRFNPASVAVRNAFLGIVSLNFRSVATNLQKAIQKDRARVEKFWTSAGGKFDALQNVVNKGAARKRLGGIGLAPAAAPAAATVATPLIIKAVNLFKEMGIDAGDLADFGQGVVNRIAQKRLDQLDEAEETGEISDGTDINEFMPGGSGEGSASSPGGGSMEEFSSDPTGTSILNNKTLLIAGAAAAAFFLLRKK